MRSSVPTWEKNSSILMEDGYTWRKYGQKMTMNAKYLRYIYSTISNCNQPKIPLSLYIIKPFLLNDVSNIIQIINVCVETTTDALTSMMRVVQQ